MATPAAGLPADAPESRFTIAELRARHQAIIKAKQLAAARQPVLDQAKQLGALLATRINETQSLRNKLDDLLASGTALRALQAIIQSEDGNTKQVAVDLKARADALVRLQARRDLALAAYRRESQPSGLGQDYAGIYRDQIQKGVLQKVRDGVTPFCDGGNCGFDPREPSEIYLAKQVGPDWESQMQPYQADPSGLYISMLQWKGAEDQSTRNLDAPWPGESPDAVPEPSDPRLKFARTTDNYGMFASSQNYDVSQLTQHEGIFLQANRGAYLRRQAAKERAADAQIGLYIAAGLLVAVTAGGASPLLFGAGSAGFATGTAVEAAAATVAAASTAALAAALASAAAANVKPADLTDPLVVLASLDKVVFRPVIQNVAQPVFKEIIKTSAILDKTVPGWAVVLDFILPIGPLLPTLLSAIADTAGIGFDALNLVLQAGGKVAEAFHLGPVYDASAEVVSSATRQALAGSIGRLAVQSQGITARDLLFHVAAVGKAIATVETTKGDLLQKIEAASIEVAQGVAAVAALATAVFSGGTTLALYASAQALMIASRATALAGVDPTISMALQLTATAVSLLEAAYTPTTDPTGLIGGNVILTTGGTPFAPGLLALSVLQQAMNAGVLVGQADQSARATRTAARAARNAVLEAAAQVDLATGKIEEEIAQIQEARRALRARMGLLGQARGFVLPLADQLGVSEDTVLVGGVVGVGILAFLLGLVGD